MKGQSKNNERKKRGKGKMILHSRKKPGDDD
jgi:hypothetical protein